VEQAVIVHVRLSNSGSDSFEEREGLFALQEQIAEAIRDAAAGDFDGDLWGEGECIFYMYGPDADRLFSAIELLLRSCPLSAGGYAIKRYGGAGDPDAREIRVAL
jgi:hypothetical protein